MKRTPAILWLALITLFFTTVVLAEESKCSTYWLHPDQPPLVIKKGYGAGMGAVDLTEKYFADRMKDCAHRFDDANYERILTTIKETENACSVPLYITPEREKFIEFSVPYAVVIPNALIILEAQKQKFGPFMNKEGEVSLEDVIKKGFRIGIAKGRVYRGVIDEILKRYKNHANIIEHTSSQEMITNLTKMMAAGRIDALVGYPFEAQYVAKTMGKKVNVLSIPVAGMDAYGLTAVGCSKTRQGKEIIRRLNAIIMESRTTPEFVGYHERWLDPAAVRRHQRYTVKEFGEKADNR